jgi:hypothetical protein
MPRSPERRLY